MATQQYNTAEARINKLKGEILAHAEPKLVLGISGDQKKMGRNQSDTIIYRRWVPYGGTAGTAAGTILAYHQDYPYEKPEKYFDVQYTREGLFQGIYHQVFQNFVECPLLSPYHTFQIWEDVINHLDPRVIKKGTDFRDEIGRKLSGRSINWDNENPHLAPYKYNDPIDSYSLYLKYIHDNTNSVNSEN